MRIIQFIVSGLITVFLIVVLNSSWLLPAPLGKLVSPQHGLWQNAEAANHDYSADLSFNDLQGRVEVYFDERLVPHIFAQNDEDVYFVQGYLHARFRLWQMEFQTLAAAGRVSEIAGKAALDFDRDKRRLGMVYAAEASLKAAEEDPETLRELNLYTAGVNAYIAGLTESTLPFEYKLLNYKPEKWTNLKTALFLKYMALDLAGYETDFEMANAKSVFSTADFNKIYPIVADSLDPIVPRNTVFDTPGIQVSTPPGADSIYWNRGDSNRITPLQRDRDNGSNNWAVAGSKTSSGAPILANDPHLGLNLPSLWYEMQVTTPNYNAYGVSFPGAPAIIIGFNDSIAFGFTNAMRDVRDYYEIRFKDETRREYWFDSTWLPSTMRVEQIQMKGSAPFYDTVVYTHIGPVMYDPAFSGSRGTNAKNYAVRWKAHDPSNEMKVFTLLNKAKNYDEYYAAIQYLETPGQNCIFASKSGDIAIWNQGKFPAKWYRQGDFPMPGTDSSYFWQGVIPQNENPHQVNPERGFVSSANQLPTDTTYPYYLGGSYPPYRGIEINRRLRSMQQITPEQMMNLQVDNYNVFAEMAVPVLIQYLQPASFDDTQNEYYEELVRWNYVNDPASLGTTLFVTLWDSLESVIWRPYLENDSLQLPWPHESTFLEWLREDSAPQFFDNPHTSETETPGDLVNLAFKKATTTLEKYRQQDRIQWAAFKDTKVMHLLRRDALSRMHLPIGGGEHVINATKHQHGPSWRMVVSLTAETEAYGIYPGGQSGNPGSKFYDNFVDRWVAGEYYKSWIMTASDKTDKRILSKMIFNPA